ncbi:MarR family winged helix-turn-helix transcriptional regulator [Shinella sp. NM-101]|uniref:MarR family winged helix-turn-helix transcriptional regulator n=1 Tax=Shinella sp. NM-101 TaxID=2744455 RepID=UPI001F346BBE|nr:MarR family transcriptional regulator [Shinella sp. NM-101]
MRPLTELPGHLIRRLQQISVSAFTSEMAAIDVELTPVQFAALTTLREHPGLDQATLAGLIAYDRVTIGGVVARLEARGYLERAVSGVDRRARILNVTTKGAALLDQIDDAVLRAQELMLPGLTAGERAIFIELLRKVTEAGNEISRAPFRPVSTSESSA